MEFNQKDVEFVSDSNSSQEEMKKNQESKSSEENEIYKYMEYLTPKKIVEELDKYIIGQKKAKKIVSIAIRNRLRRQKIKDPTLKDEVYPKNIIMIGPTGCGKTEIARRLAKLTKAPFIKVEATKFTEVGYVGRDVDSMVRDLVAASINMVRREYEKKVEQEAIRRTEERIMDAIIYGDKKKESNENDIKNTNIIFKMMSELTQVGKQIPDSGEQENKVETEEVWNLKKILREQLRRGELDNREITIEIQVSGVPFLQITSGPNFEDLDMNIGRMFEDFFPKKTKKKKVKVVDAKKILLQQEMDKLIDFENVKHEAIQRAEQLGIIFIDEIDKICGKGGHIGPDVSREGVQRDLLPIVEGTTVSTKYGPVKTDYILFIAAGAFHITKPSDLIPELQGRFPLRVELEELTKEDFKKILTVPNNSLTKQAVALMGTEGIELEFTEDSIEEMASLAYELNNRMENIGARRLYTIIETVMEDISYEAPEIKENKFIIDAKYVREKIAPIVEKKDLSQYIL